MWMFFLLIEIALAAPLQRQFVDHTHASAVFGEQRNYRIFLPADYASARQRSYPVLYYFHGHSDRYTLEKYDEGKDTVPKIERFVSTHPAIVVAVDGYVAKDYTGFYGGTPWDIGEDGGRMDFGLYFKELVAHIDSTYRTQKTRRSRAISGLSMGGFMSLYLSARFPDLLGSASAFNPGPEFYSGEPGARILWRPKDHVAAHGATKMRLVRASGDYISQYHEETREAYASATQVDFEYRRDEYHRHWATSIGETFEFHMRAFQELKLDTVPARWSYDCAMRDCQVWGYRVQTANPSPGYVYLEDITRNSLRVFTRRWAPDGPPLLNQAITITTAPLYLANAKYVVRDLDANTRQLNADSAGRLTLHLNAAFHQIGIEGPGIETSARPVILPLPNLHLLPEIVHSLPLRIYNPHSKAIQALRIQFTSEYPNAQIESGSFTIARIEPGKIVQLDPRASFTSSDGEFQRIRLNVDYDAEGAKGSAHFNVHVAPANTTPPWQMEILDGRTITLPVFRQKGNQGGGSTIQRTVTEGRGNGNGILEPGEQATIWIRLRQGLDPFDKGHWYRTKIYSGSQWLHEVADIAEQKQLEWTGAKERTSLIELNEATPTGTQIPLLLDNESWSYQFTPDLRYGKELLYQAFQMHGHHVHTTTLHHELKEK